MIIFSSSRLGGSRRASRTCRWGIGPNGFARHPSSAARPSRRLHSLVEEPVEGLLVARVEELKQLCGTAFRHGWNVSRIGEPPRRCSCNPWHPIPSWLMPYSTICAGLRQGGRAKSTTETPRHGCTRAAGPSSSPAGTDSPMGWSSYVSTRGGRVEGSV